MYTHVCLHASEGQTSTLGIFLCLTLPCVLRQALPELTLLAKVAGQQAYGICLLYHWPQAAVPGIVTPAMQWVFTQSPGIRTQIFTLAWRALNSLSRLPVML